jgi:hypothetical protein
MGSAHLKGTEKSLAKVWQPGNVGQDQGCRSGKKMIKTVSKTVGIDAGRSLAGQGNFHFPLNSVDTLTLYRNPNYR